MRGFKYFFKYTEVGVAAISGTGASWTQEELEIEPLAL